MPPRLLPRRVRASSAHPMVRALIAVIALAVPMLCAVSGQTPRANAVVAGSLAEPAPWIAQVLSYHVVPPAPCTATVIDPLWLVTAAHCGPADPATLTVAFGNLAPVPGALADGSLGSPALAGTAMGLPGSSDIGFLGRVRPVAAYRSPTGDVMLIRLASPAPAPAVRRARVDPAPGTLLRFYGFGAFLPGMQYGPPSPVLLTGDTVVDRFAPRGGSRIGLSHTVRGGYGLGDSGGPLFLGGDLVGTHSGSDHTHQGPDGLNSAWYESIPAQNRWIDDTLARG